MKQKKTTENKEKRTNEMNKTLKRGDKITYTREYHFGKRSQVTATVIMTHGITALLSNGDKIYNYDPTQKYVSYPK